jgi:hypothetical protein
VEFEIAEFLKRINGLSQGLLRCEFDFVQLSALGPEWNSEDITSMASASFKSVLPKYIENRHGRFAFPLFSESKCHGVLTVTGFADYSHKNLVLMSDFISLVTFDFSHSRKDAGESLDTQDSNSSHEPLSSQTSGKGDHKTAYQPAFGSLSKIVVKNEAKRDGERNDQNDKIISISEERKQRGLPAETLSLTDLLASIDASTKPLKLQKPVLIEASESEVAALSRIATDLHDRTGAWAMFGINDITRDVFESKTGLEELGQVTIFIPDIAKLTTQQQIRFAEQLSNPKNTLQVIAVTSMSPSELNDQRKALPYLLELCIHIDIKPEISLGKPVSMGMILNGLDRSPDYPPKPTPDHGKLIPFQKQKPDGKPTLLH